MTDKEKIEIIFEYYNNDVNIFLENIKTIFELAYDCSIYVEKTKKC